MNKLSLLDSLKEKEISQEIISAFAKTNRENFLPEHLKPFAYEDMALPLAEGSTLSQPYTTAFMLQLLDIKYSNKILEIGSGSGYVLSLMSELNGDSTIYGLEISERLAIKSRKALQEKSNVHIINQTGSQGLAKKSPFDRIIISAACKDYDLPRSLVQQLNDPGILVAPVQSSIIQIKKKNGKVSETEFPGFMFVPLRK